MVAAAGAPIVAIVETHVQEDRGPSACRERGGTGEVVGLHEAAEVGFHHAALHDDEEIPLGNDYIRVRHTPGHSPDSVTLLVGDRVRGDDPWFALTGDTLFVGGAGRPDLDADADSAAAASALYDSLKKVLALRDDLEIYPAHFAGSACGRAMRQAQLHHRLRAPLQRRAAPAQPQGVRRLHAGGPPTGTGGPSPHPAGQPAGARGARAPRRRLGGGDARIVDECGSSHPQGWAPRGARPPRQPGAVSAARPHKWLRRGHGGSGADGHAAYRPAPRSRSSSASAWSRR